MGERARNQGIEAEDKAWNFIESLGYTIEEKNNEQYDIDGLAVFLPKLKTEGLIRPRYAPEGLVAFEVTEQSFRKKKVTSFGEKIHRYNTDHPEEKIEGGILLIDHKASPEMITFMKQYGVWGWGISRQSLYKTKLRIINEWKEINRFTAEISLDETTSFLRCATPPPTNSDQLLSFAIFLDDDSIKLSLRKVSQIVDIIKGQSLIPLIKLGITPINVRFEFYSVGGSSMTKHDFEQHISPTLKVEGINVMGECCFSDYRSFPNL